MAESGAARGYTIRLTSTAGLLAFTLLAFLIHGYHYGIEDEAIYLPAIKKILDPSLYPRDSEFFMAQARGTVLPWIVAAVTRITHISLPWVVIAAQFLSIYLFLLGCWMVASRCFPALRQRWAAVGMLTALLTLPVAGSRIYLADQHLHPRTFACAFVLFAIAYSLQSQHTEALSQPWRDHRQGFACAVSCMAAALIHPLMAVYGIVFVVVLWLPPGRWTESGRRSQDAGLKIPTTVSVLVALPFLAHPTAA